jgi:hypothetical protein
MKKLGKPGSKKKGGKKSAGNLPMHTGDVRP